MTPHAPRVHLPLQKSRICEPEIYQRIRSFTTVTGTSSPGSLGAQISWGSQALGTELVRGTWSPSRLEPRQRRQSAGRRRHCKGRCLMWWPLGVMLMDGVSVLGTWQGPEITYLMRKKWVNEGVNERGSEEVNDGGQVHTAGEFLGAEVRGCNSLGPRRWHRLCPAFLLWLAFLRVAPADIRDHLHLLRQCWMFPGVGTRQRPEQGLPGVPCPRGSCGILPGGSLCLVGTRQWFHHISQRIQQTTHQEGQVMSSSHRCGN